jgi:hypothetical protein
MHLDLQCPQKDLHSRQHNNTQKDLHSGQTQQCTKRSNVLSESTKNLVTALADY